MNKYLVGLVVLVVAGICCLALFNNSQKDDTPVETEDKVNPSFATNAHSGSVTVVEEQSDVEEFVATKVEAPSNVEVEEIAVEPVIDVPMEVETEPEDIVSLDSFDRPYNHTITEEDFLKIRYCR